MAQEKDTNIFDNADVKKTYFHMVIPVVCGMVISLVYNLTDTYFVAQTGDTNLVAGVSLGAPMFTFLMALGNIFGQGGTSLASSSPSPPPMSSPSSLHWSSTGPGCAAALGQTR